MNRFRRTTRIGCYSLDARLKVMIFKKHTNVLVLFFLLVLGADICRIDSIVFGNKKYLF